MKESNLQPTDKEGDGRCFCNTMILINYLISFDLKCINNIIKIGKKFIFCHIFVEIKIEGYVKLDILIGVNPKLEFAMIGI